MLRNNQNRLQWANLPLTLFYILGRSASAGMADKFALKNTCNFSVPKGGQLTPEYPRGQHTLGNPPIINLRQFIEFTAKA